jgi:lipoate synthase
LAQAVRKLDLRHAVITSVTRDDLPDGGARHYARVVEALKRHCPDVKVELLVPDFLGSEESLTTVLASGPDILAHNIETVPRLYSGIRKGADYQRSLTLLKKAKGNFKGVTTKSGLMFGLGEENREVEEVLRDLLVFAILWWLLRGRLKQPGALFAAYLALYSLGSFSIRFLRGDVSTFAGVFNEGQVISLLVFIVAAGFLIKQYCASRRSVRRDQAATDE